ncbi:MAG: FAD-binding oxidoreductase [Anaerolineae bacterium]
MKTYDVIVIGGGVIGAASAFFSGRTGLKTVLLEKRPALGTLTTSASLAAFRAQFGEAENIAMMLESIAFFENIRERTGLPDADIQLAQQGYLFVTTAAEGYETARRRVELQRSLGLHDVELWNGEEARRHFPFLSPEVTAASFRARDGWLSPHELTYCYARGSGAEIHLETSVEALLVEGNRVYGVQSSLGEIHAPRVVVAAGPFAQNLLRPLGIHLPIDLVRRQRAAVKAHPLIPHHAPMTIDSDTGAHWRPDGQGAVLAWALPEAPGEPREEVLPDWDFPAVVLDGVARIAPFWAEVGEHLHRTDLDVRAGQYDMTPDAKPIIGPHPEWQGLYLNCGYSGHGVMASAGGGRILGDLLAGRQNPTDNPFRLVRFAENVGKPVSEKMVL